MYFTFSKILKCITGQYCAFASTWFSSYSISEFIKIIICLPKTFCIFVIFNNPLFNFCLILFNVLNLLSVVLLNMLVNKSLCHFLLFLVILFYIIYNDIPLSFSCHYSLKKIIFLFAHLHTFLPLVHVNFSLPSCSSHFSLRNNINFVS